MQREFVINRALNTILQRGKTLLLQSNKTNKIFMNFCLTGHNIYKYTCKLSGTSTGPISFLSGLKIDPVQIIDPRDVEASLT